MVGVLVDACGWVSLVDAGLNLDISLNKAIGEAELKITDSVKRELDSLASRRGGLLLNLLLTCPKTQQLKRKLLVLYSDSPTN